jgi:hypothetical protein
MKTPLVLLLCSVSLLAAVDYAAEGKLWWAHIEFLASDDMRGRDTGSPEFRKATEYVAGKFEKLGLKPAGTSAYFQPIKFETRTLIPAESSIELVRDGKRETVEIGKDATLSARGDLVPLVHAPLVFAGYGLVIPEAKYDDLAGLDLKGKVAVVVNASGPVQADSNIKSHYSSGVERWNVLRKAGAIGIAVIQNPRTAGTQGTLPATGANAPPPPPVVLLADPALSETQGQNLTITILPAGGPKFFEGSEHSWDEIFKLASESQPLPRFNMAATIEAKVTAKVQSMEAANVVGMIPGSDPKLKNEYVVFSAHLDHTGVGRPVDGDNIYNGAMDNASGVASVLEVARLFHGSKAKPKRSVVFLTVAAEEKGELGSRFFAGHPTVPKGDIVADINLDMFLPLYPLKVLEVQGLAESTLGDAVRFAAKAEGVDVQTDREPEQNRFIRSDQYSFIREGVPALAFKFGYEFGSEDEKTRLAWVKERYHRPSDDLTQPVDTAAAARFNHIIFNLINRVADDKDRPHWKQESFFRRFAASGH